MTALPARDAKTTPGAAPPAGFGDPATVAAPYDWYASLRESHGLVRDEALGAWLVARHADVLDAAREPRLSVQPNASFLGRLPTADPHAEPLVRFFRTWLSFSDPPLHGTRRGPWARLITPQSVARLRVVAHEAAEHLASKAVLAGECDVVADFTPLPVIVLARFLGLTIHELQGFRPWIEQLGLFMTSPTPAHAAAAAAALGTWRAWLDDWLDATPGSQASAGALRALDSDQAGVPRDELFAMLAGLVTGPPSQQRGTLEPTVQFLAKAVDLLLPRPEVLDAFRDDPTSIAAAVDELLRLEPPFHYVTRHASEDLVLSGTQIRQGDRLLLLLASANRDPACYDEADELRPGRTDGKHVAFGFGSHFCLGALLARTEIEVALAVVAQRLHPARRVGPVRWRMEGGFRALDQLRLEVLAEPRADPDLDGPDEIESLLAMLEMESGPGTQDRAHP